LLDIERVAVLDAAAPELWFEQKFANDRIAIRVGQLAADTEFINSSYAGVFINSSFGWPAITALNLPSGGPAPPLAVPGVRLRAKVTDEITMLAAIFDGDAAGPGPGDPQTRNRYGLNFRVNDPPFAIGEIQYNHGTAKGSAILPGSVKLGGWYHAGLFNDQHFTQAGLSLANPSGTGIAAQRRGDHGIYGVFEQALYQFGGSKDRDIGIFARVSGSPSDRNLVDFLRTPESRSTGPCQTDPTTNLVSVSRMRGFRSARASLTGIFNCSRGYSASSVIPRWCLPRPIGPIFATDG
jgi:porin